MSGHRRNMALEIFNLLLFTHIFTARFSRIVTQETHGQAFIQTDNELKYVPDIVHGLPKGEDLSIRSSEKSNRPLNPLVFNPPMLDFNEQSVGMPRMETVEVHNPDTINSLHLLSISGSTLHFHCSFFQDKIVSAGGNTTFDIVFLARQVGNVENTLYIHTSVGTFKYQVFGVGKPNPYRLRPFLGARVPLNSSFSPLIHMHNPHSTAIQVVEMFSSGGDLHLELPTGEKEASQNLWEILPYETKPVMRASFIGRKESNHTAYIRIKTREKKEEILVLPVEVEVTSSPGIFSTVETLDFGIMRSNDIPKTLRLNLINSSQKPIHIQSISLSPPNEAIKIDFRPIKLKLDVIQSTTVAKLMLAAYKVYQPSQLTGKIIVKSKDGKHKLSVPYQVDVMRGTLEYNASDIWFRSGKPPYKNITRTMSLTNTFNLMVMVYNVTLPKDREKYFTIIHNEYPIMMKPREKVDVFNIHFHPNESNLQYFTQISVLSNCSVFTVAIVVYNGLLQVVHHTPPTFNDQLDFGTLGMEEKRSLNFTLKNFNPIDIAIEDYGTSMQKTTLRLIGIEKGNCTTLSKTHNVSASKVLPLVIPPYHYAVFSVDIVAPDYEGAFASDITFKTKSEWLHIPFTLRTAEGSLTSIPETVILDGIFPGKVVHKELKIHSSFDGFMELEEVSFTPNDERFYYKRPGKSRIEIDLGDNPIGQLYFDAKKTCKDDCYVGLPTNTPAGHQWLLGLALDKDVADTDQYLYTKFRQKWDHIVSTQQSMVSVKVNLNTDAFRGFFFHTQAHHEWPSIVSASHTRFPLTQIGNQTELLVHVNNPSDEHVVFQAIPLAHYPNPQTILDLLKTKLLSLLNNSDLIETDDVDVFLLQNFSAYSKNLNASNHTENWQNQISEKYGVIVHNKSVVMDLAKGQKVDFSVRFQPKDDISRSTVIVIRNNLTILDAVVIQGKGAYGEMKLGNRKPGSSSPLLFEVTDKHLKACETAATEKKSSASAFTVRRSFNLKNTGSLPFYVHGFNINDLPCSGFGFRVLGCTTGFEVKSNATRKIDIVFTPDFTMSRIQRTLQIFTSLGNPINYTLQATIPAFMLAQCSAALPRPSWEPLIYYSTLCLMGFLVFCILVTSYFESDRIFTADIMRRSRVTFEGQGKPFLQSLKVFDLRNISTSHETTIQDKSLPEENGLILNKHITHGNNNTESYVPPISSKLGRIPDLTLVNSKHPPTSRQTSKKLSKLSKKNSSHSPTTADEPTMDDNNVDTFLNKATTDFTMTYPSHIDKGTIIDTEDDPINSIDDVINDPVLKKEVKSKTKRKSKASHKQMDEKEKEKEKQQIFLDDKDETSSSTTESSCLDGEEKNSGSARDSTPEPIIPKPKKITKKKNQSNKISNNDTRSLTVKAGKPQYQHKETRGNSKQLFTGNIHQPDTLSLPYTLPNQDRLEPVSPHTIAAASVSRVMKPNLKLKTPGVIHVTEPEETDSDASKNSPPILWDQPYPESQQPGDLDDLSKVTKHFAKTYNITDQLSSSSRSNSYSSMVSSSGSDSNGKQSAFSPVNHNNGQGSNLPKPGNGSPAAAVAVAVAVAAANGQMNGTDRWNTISPGSPTTPYVRRDPSEVATFIQGLSVNNSINMPVYGQNLGKAKPAAGYRPTGQTVSNPVFEHPTTMMQQLQADRRRRLLEHQQRLARGEEWPGFGIDHVASESLWDNNFAQNQEDSSIWHGISASPGIDDDHYVWNNTLADIWGASGPPGPPGPPEPSLTSAATSNDTHLGSQVQSGGFDPWAANVQSLGAIWNQGSPHGMGAHAGAVAGAVAGAGWSYSTSPGAEPQHKTDE